jgi:hypothetical protein
MRKNPDQGSLLATLCRYAHSVVVGDAGAGRGVIGMAVQQHGSTAAWQYYLVCRWCSAMHGRVDNEQANGKIGG